MKNTIPVEKLEPQFIRLTTKGLQPVATINEAQGVMFKCPKCFVMNNGPAGTHMVICWSRSRGVPDDVSPGPGRWKIEGTTLNDLTLGADAPSKKRSVHLTGGCEWHGFITEGKATI